MAKLDELLADSKIQELIASIQAGLPGKRLRPIETAAGVIICQNPSKAQWQQFVAGVADDDKNTMIKSVEIFLRGVTVHPDAKTLENWIDNYPGITGDPDTILELRKLAGAAKEQATK